MNTNQINNNDNNIYRYYEIFYNNKINLIEIKNKSEGEYTQWLFDKIKKIIIKNIQNKIQQNKICYAVDFQYPINENIKIGNLKIGFYENKKKDKPLHFLKILVQKYFT